MGCVWWLSRAVGHCVWMKKEPGVFGVLMRYYPTFVVVILLASHDDLQLWIGVLMRYHLTFGVVIFFVVVILLASHDDLQL